MLTKADPIKENFESSSDLLNVKMHESDVPQGMRQLFREYLREAKRYNEMKLFRDLADAFSPLLRGHLLLHMSENWISSIYYFNLAPQMLVIDIAEKLSSRFYARREPLLDVRYCLCIVDRGTIAHGGNVVTTGNAFQKDMIVTLKALQHIKPTVSLTYAQVLVLTREDLDDILTEYASFERLIRKQALKIALARVAKLCARQSQHLTKNGHAAPTLVQAFGMLDVNATADGCMPQENWHPKGKEPEAVNVRKIISAATHKMQAQADKGIVQDESLALDSAHHR